MAPAFSEECRGRKGGRIKRVGGGEGREQWMAIERPHTHTLIHIIQLVALQSSLKVVARLQICRIQFANFPIDASSSSLSSSVYKNPKKWRRKENLNQIKIHFWQHEHTSGLRLSSFLFSGKRNEPLENSSTALEYWGPLSLKISLKKHNRQSHRVHLMGSVCFEIAAQAPDRDTDTDTDILSSYIQQ